MKFNSLKLFFLVCGTTGKRKACKDCSCGLAEELGAGQAVKTTTTSATSSCGSVRLQRYDAMCTFILFI